MGAGITVDLSTVSVAIAALTVLITIFREHRTASGDNQWLRDSVGMLKDTARDTRQGVSEINRKLDDHGARLVRLETTVEQHAERMDRIEHASSRVASGD